MFPLPATFALQRKGSIEGNSGRFAARPGLWEVAIAVTAVAERAAPKLCVQEGEVEGEGDGYGLETVTLKIVAFPLSLQPNVL